MIPESWHDPLAGLHMFTPCHPRVQNQNHLEAVASCNRFRKALDGISLSAPAARLQAATVMSVASTGLDRHLMTAQTGF